MKTKVLAFFMLLVAATIEVQASTITLTSETGEIELQDGDVLTGIGGTNTRVSIADGATVTLDDVNIDANDNQWPGIACNGNAEIVLMGTSSLHGGTQRSGIAVPEGKTLTLRGDGTLTAVGAMSAAGIGGTAAINCGNIVILGGSITAIGGYYAAGIGCGAYDSMCGNISISGGTITAVGGYHAAGIGCGESGTLYSSITIATDVTNLSVTAGEYASAIGGGSHENNVLGSIIIDGSLVGDIRKSPFEYTPADTSATYTIHFDKNWDMIQGIMDDQMFTFNKPQTLTFCGFTCDEYHYFAGWNTSADGKGYSYSDGQNVINVGNATFYAQWNGVEYDITYINAIDGEDDVTNDNPTSYTIDDDITLKEPLRPGWNFDGWTYEGQDTPTKDVNIPCGSTGKRTFTAHWSFNPVYTIYSGTRDVLLENGRTLTGAGGSETHVTIADGATVTLKDVNITNISKNSRHGWAGISCLGDATIILVGENAVTGGHHSAGIFVPADKTLTIRGDGLLRAVGDTTYGAGIGCNRETDCGNIVIEGGNITSIGGNYSAGIGCCYTKTTCGNIVIKGGTITSTGGIDAAGIGSSYTGSTCGNIVIKGGNITSTGGGTDAAGIGSSYTKTTCGNIVIEGGTITSTGGKKAAGIGSGYRSTCGNITIIRTVVSVTAIAGRSSMHSIGMGHNSSTCGKVTIGGLKGYISESPYTYIPDGTLTSIIHFDSNGGKGTMDDWLFTYNGSEQTIPACMFESPAESVFLGWNTLADGGGCYFAAGEPILDISNVTLYAQWRPQTITVNSSTGTIELCDGQTITGTGGSETHVTIADGATVTLRDVNITSIPRSSSHEWAGITCLGNATIILVGDNAVTGGYQSAGIFVPAGKTLTIRGNGSLSATGNKSAGIGCNSETDCGNIVIEGGNITSIGGNNAAGIGSGYTGSTCGNITITRLVVSVTAIKGANAMHSIGMGHNSSTCGKVTIGGLKGYISESPYTYIPDGTLTSIIHFDSNGGKGTMDDWLFTYNGSEQTFPACTFESPEGAAFFGWSTLADGGGLYYAAGEPITDIGNVTLYAQWKPRVITINSSTEIMELYDGLTITGTGGSETHVTIADGATVTLKDINITSIANNQRHGWAGISCLGDATIILVGDNAVTGGYQSAGVFVPAGKTLTIRGNGSMVATGNTSYAAGIGGNKGTDCGNIVIEGGCITATGKVGIGCAQDASCGNITITKDVTYVCATKSSASKSIYPIGLNGSSSTCGTISIAEELTDVTVDKTRYIAKPDWTDTISVTLTKEGYATYFSSFDMVLPAGMKARVVTADEGNGQLTYKTIAKGGTPDNTVPAQTPVLLQMPSADNEQTLDICIMVSNSLLTIEPNLLGGKDKESWTTGGDEEAKYYKLSYDSVGSNLGWYWGEENGESYKSEAHHAWLALPSTSASVNYSFLPLPDYNYDDITTASPVVVGDPSMNADDASARPRKVLEGNSVVIIRSGQRYDLLGRKIK